MKVNWNSKYNTIATYAFLVAASIMLFYVALNQMEIITDKVSGILYIFKPFIIGFSIAYLCNFILKFFENKVFRYKLFDKLKSKRGLGILFTYITVLIGLALFMYFVVPQLMDSIVGLINDIPTYVNNLNELITNTLQKFDIEQQYYDLAMENINQFINYIIKIASDFLPVVAGVLSTVASSVWNIILGIIISIYLLIEKEKFYGISKKITYALASRERAERILELTHRSNETFGKFISGKILDSAIIAVLTFVILTIFNIPYTLLISTIIGITNIIPFFGPFIGAIPSAIIILFVSPVKALTFIIIILVIQQIDGNIIGPKILGDSIGISAFWILFSILIAGKLLGFIGMVLGVPLFAVIYSIIKEVIERRLARKGLKTETEDYI